MIDQPVDIEEVHFLKDNYQRPFCKYPSEGFLELEETKIFDGWITFSNLTEEKIYIKVDFTLPNGYFVQLIDENNQVNHSEYISMHKSYQIAQENGMFTIFE